MEILSRFALTGKVAVVTGASSGLGAHASVGLAQAGADLVLVARRADRLAETCAAVEAAGRRCIAVQGDVVDPVTADRAVDDALDAFGTVNILLNGAGVGTAVPATRETPAEFRRVIEVNLYGSYWMAQACGRVMPPNSSIINVGSILGFTSTGLPQAAYASSKAAIVGLTRDLSAQWTGRRGIRVNAIAPGFFATEMTEQLQDGYVDRILSDRASVARYGEPEEFVCAVVFLASTASSYVTGVTLPVDGGILTT